MVCQYGVPAWIFGLQYGCLVHGLVDHSLNLQQARTQLLIKAVVLVRLCSEHYSEHICVVGLTPR